MSIVSGTIAALGQRKSAKEQNALTAQQNKDTLSLELAARGAPLSGSGVPEELQGVQSAFLPYYFGSLEKDTAGDAASIYRALKDRMGDPALKLADYSEMLGKYKDSQNSADALADEIMSGRLSDTVMSENAPVFEARLGVAEANRNAGLEALKQTLNEIDNIQAGKGYSGDSTGKRMLRFNARRQIGNQASNEFANAKLANAQDKRAALEAVRSLRMSNFDLPAKMARNRIAIEEMPATAIAESYRNTLSPLDSFRIGSGSFSKPTQMSAMPNTAGDIANAAAQTGSAVGGALMKYYGNKDLTRQATINAYANSGAAPSNFGSMSAAQQGQYYDQVQAANNWIAANPEEYASFQ